LQTKDPTEYTGVESYVANKYASDDISFIPMHKALALDSRLNQKQKQD